MNFELSNGVRIPAVGLGTWQSTGDDVYRAVRHALDAGYRHIDDAAAYENEEVVGRAIADSGLPRSEVFLTTKIWNDVADAEGTRRAVEESLERLGTDYVDLLLMHWPGEYPRNAAVYKGMEEAFNTGRARAIGLSNCAIHHIDALLRTAAIPPVVNQVECHVTVQNHRLQRYCAEKGIRLQAYAPLMSRKVRWILENDTLRDIGAAYGKTPTQAAIRWLLERGIVALPKSVTPSRIEENFDVFDFSLSGDDMARIRRLNTGAKLFFDPDNIDFGFPIED